MFLTLTLARNALEIFGMKRSSNQMMNHLINVRFGMVVNKERVESFLSEEILQSNDESFDR